MPESELTIASGSSVKVLLVSFLTAPFAFAYLNTALCSASLCLSTTVCSSTLFNVLRSRQTLAGWIWTVKHLLLEYRLLTGYKPRYMDSWRIKERKAE